MQLKIDSFMDCRNSPGTVGLDIYIFDLIVEIKNSFFFFVDGGAGVHVVKV